ncbi:hypothetical protein DESUT3_38880 [Desulfuromonas versatilis]|uniref:Uncharacterized protein n=1 Tax=Desulfuromonas versatilis TaxID=2802975 RepID=A0ABM8I1W4_9BACT|nr:hypothetical protein [Desulfuromonas versatilis]BCR06819.1 hypothetical protein DESUT3_38880 [Desulfuromonas versatilis]
MNQVRIGSWNELQDQLFADSWNPDLGRFRSRLAFRGLSDAGYPLATTLERLGGEFTSLERHYSPSSAKQPALRAVAGW